MSATKAPRRFEPGDFPRARCQGCTALCLPSSVALFNPPPDVPVQQQLTLCAGCGEAAVALGATRATSR